MRGLQISCVFLFAISAGASPAYAQTSNPFHFGTFSIGEVWIQLDGDFEDYALDSGSLPPGVELRPDVPPWFPPTSHAGLIGIATTPGTSTFSLLRDGIPEAHEIKITALAMKGGWDFGPDSFVGVPFSAQFETLNATGGVTWDVNESTLPPGLSMDASGLLSGTPTASGFYGVSVNVTDSDDSVWWNFNVRVYDVRVSAPDALADGSLPNATVNVPYSTTITATGGTAPYSFTTFSLPQGLSLDDLSGVISGTSTGSGRWSLDVTATDDNGISHVKRMSLTVLNVPASMPSVEPYGNFLEDCAIGVPCTRGVHGGYGSAPFTWSASGLPPGMDFRWGSDSTTWWINPGDLELWGTPTAVGTFQIQVTVTDATGQKATNSFPLKVGELRLWSYLQGGFIDQPYSHTLYIIGGMRPYTASIVGGRLPVGLALDPDDLIVSGTPLENGWFDVILEFVDDGGNTLRVKNYFYIGSLTSTVNINSFWDLGFYTEGFSFSRQLDACCVPSYLWTLQGGALPAGVTLSSNGMLSGTPGAGTSGVHDFLVRVEDATNPANFAVSQFRLSVTTLSIGSNFNLPHGNVGTPYSTSLSASGGSGITWTLEPYQYLPPGLTLSSGGTISGTPTARGRADFNVRASDGAGHTITRSFAINVYAAGENPPLDFQFGPNLGTVTIGTASWQFEAGSGFGNSVSGGTPPYVFSVTPGEDELPGFRVQNGPPFPTFFSTSALGTLIGVSTAPGSYPTSIRVTDSLGQFLDRAGTLTVSPLHLPSPSPPKATVGSPYSFTLTPHGGTAYSWSANNMPPGLSLDASGQILGTPTAPGTFFPSVTLTDLPTSASVNIGFAFVVNAFEITTGGVLPSGSTGVFYSQSFSAPGCSGTCNWTISSGGVSGLSLGSGGTLSGTPNGTFNGSITVQASGSNGVVQKTVALRINSATPQPLSITTSSFSDMTVGNFASTGLFVQGGTAPYTWALDDGALPPGISLQGPGETLGASLIPGFTYLAGPGLEIGVYSFTLRVTDGASATTTRAYTWRVSPLAFWYTNLPVSGSTLLTGGDSQLTYNVPYTQPLLVVGGTGSYSWTSGPMPPGLALNPSTGVVSGTPSNTGVFNVPVTATDGAGATMTSNVNFNIGSGTASTLSFGPNNGNYGVVQLGSVPSLGVSPSGGTGPYTVTALSTLPPGLVLQGTAGSITGIATTPGTHSFTLQATDSVGNIGVRTFTVTVAGFATFSESVRLPDASVGEPYSHQVSTFGGGATAWSLFSGTLPGGLSISSGGLISGTPTTSGTSNFSLGATNGGVTVSVGTSLRVSNIAITDGQVLPTATFGQFYSFTFTATGGGPVKSWSGGGADLFLSSDGTLSGTPDSTGGAFTLTVTVTDGVVQLTRRFVLPVRSPNPAVLDIPNASTLLTDATVGQVQAYSLTANGGVPLYSWSLAGGSTLPPGLTLAAGPLGTSAPGTTLLTGIPTAAGNHGFDLIVTDSTGQTARRTFTLKVSSIGLVSTSVSAFGGGPIAVSSQLLAVGGSGPYTFGMAPTGPLQDMLPAGVTLSSSGLLSGSATSTGFYRFQLTATDSVGAAVTRRFVLTIARTPGNLLVETINPSFSLGRRAFQSLSAVQANGFTPSSMLWSVTGGALPPGVFLSTDEEFVGFNSTALIGQPTAAGTFSYTLRATSTSDATVFADHAFTATVNGLQALVGALSGIPAGHVGDAYSFALRASGGVPPYTFTPQATTPLPAGLTLSAGGVLSGIPTTTGDHTVAFTLADSAGASLSSTISVIITNAGVPAPLLPSTTSAWNAATVGVPFSWSMTGFAGGGVLPYTVAVEPSTTLPPGLELMPGGNGVPTFLAGVPTDPGEHEFALVFSDSSGQTVTVPLGLYVDSIGFSAHTAPHGKVGVPYSLSLGVFGGTPPYTVLAYPTGDLPPGLTLSSTGVLSGVPQSPGVFAVQARVMDGVGDQMEKFYRIAIDNAAGEVPAVSLAPNPIEIYYQMGGPAPVVPIAVNTTSGTQPFTFNLAGAPWASLSATSGSAPTSVNLLVNPTGLAAGTYFGHLGIAAPSSVNLPDAAPVILSVVPAPPCTYAVNPTAGNSPAAGGTGGFDVAAGAGCSWSTAVSDPWITVTGGSSGTANGTVSYSVDPNAGASRSGTIDVNGAVYTITQFGAECSFAINPGSLVAPASGGVASVAITASATCGATGWTASGLGATPGSGVGDGSVAITIPVNTNAAPQVLSATIAGHTFLVNQAGASCTVALSSPSASHTTAGGSGAVNVTTAAGCPYSTVTGPSWISVTSGGSGTGSGTLVYSVEPNSTTFSRNGTLTIGGAPFAINQEAQACSATLNTSLLGSPMAAGGGSGSIGIAMNGSNCSWTALSGAGWASVAPPSGTGNGTIFVTSSSNAASTTARSTSLAIAGQSVGLNQAGTTCTYGLLSSTGSVPAAGGSGSVGVVSPAACSWASSSDDPSWLSISSSGSGGTANVNFVAQPNPVSTSRTGSLTIAGLTYTVNQAAAPCSYTLNTTNLAVSADGAEGSFTISTPTLGCSPTAISYASWAGTGVSFSGTSGTVSFVADPNPSSLTRLGIVQVGNQNFTITQLGAACAYSLNAYGAWFNSGGGSASFLGSPSGIGCSPTVGVDLPTIVTLGPLEGPVSNIFTLPYDVSPFTGSLTPLVRRARITFGGRIFIVKQSSW